MLFRDVKRPQSGDTIYEFRVISILFMPRKRNIKKYRILRGRSEESQGENHLLLEAFTRYYHLVFL